MYWHAGKLNQLLLICFFFFLWEFHFGAALHTLHSYLVNRRCWVEEEFFPWVPTVLCNYIKTEHLD